MRVNFYSKSLLSELDLTTMGGSSKRGNDSLIGMYASGLKHAVAIFNRNGVDFSVRVNTNQYIENFDRDLSITYTVDTYFQEDEQTGKEKELIKFLKNSNYQNFHTSVTSDEWGGDYESELLTGLSVELGFDWKLEYALREIWSNMIDEEGWFDEKEIPDTLKEGTVISLEFKDDSDFADIWRNRHLYFLIDEPKVIFKKYSNTVEIRDTETEYLRIYKRGILVYENKKTKSKYTYNINFGELDERRVLSDIYSIKNQIAEIIFHDDSDACLDFILNTKGDESDVFNKDSIWFQSPSDKMVQRVLDMDGDIQTFNFVLEALKKMDNSPLAGRKIKTLKESIYEVQRTVEVKETPRQIEAIPENLSISEQLSKKYDFTFEFPIKQATVFGSNVVADKFNNVILVSEEFDLKNESHIIDFFIQYFDMTEQGKGNVLKKITKFMVSKIEK